MSETSVKESTAVFEFVGPEGVPLKLKRASYAERVGAFMFDVGILVIPAYFISQLLAIYDNQGLAFYKLIMIGDVFKGDLHIAVFALLFFFARTLYFPITEFKYQGRTPGKRSIGIQVIAADGGPLLLESVLLRHFFRELECFFPLTMIFLLYDVENAQYYAILWATFLMVLPLFHEKFQRIGDRVARTYVITVPLTSAPEEIGSLPEETEPRHTFEPDHMKHYGEFELVKLEEIIRGSIQATDKQLEDICTVICRKIGYDEEVTNHWTFIHAFYRNQRAYLESLIIHKQGVGNKEQAAVKNRNHNKSKT